MRYFWIFQQENILTCQRNLQTKKLSLSGLKCHFFNRNVDPIIFGIWNGKNSLFITQGTLQFPCASQFFPIHGLAVVVKEKSSTHSFAARGGFFFQHAC